MSSAEEHVEGGAAGRRDEARQAMYRGLILDAAEEVFAGQGFAGTRVKEVAATARISLSTLYSHFRAKMDLYSATHGRRLEQLTVALKLAARGVEGPLELMLTGMGVYLRFHMEHPTYLRMHLREGIAWSEADGLRSPEQVEAWTRGLHRMARTFRAGMDAGVFAVDDPLLAARTTNAMHQVALSRSIEREMKDGPDGVVAAAEARFIRAFCAPEHIVTLLKERADRGRP